MRRTLLKTLLVAAGMAAGASGALAQDTYETVYTRVNTFGDANIWTTDDITDWGGNSYLTVSVQTTEGEEKKYGLGVNGNQTWSATKTFADIAENSKIKYEINWYMGSSTGRTNNFSYIQFGEKVRISWNSNYIFYLNTDGTSSATTQIGSKGSNTTYTKPITIIFNTATATVESFVFDDTDITSQVSGALEGNFNSVSMGFIRGGSVSWTIPCFITSITVSECKQTVQTANYTINYTLNGTTVKSETGSTVVKESVTAETVVYDDNDVRYLIVADAAPSFEVSATESENVFNVPVRKPYTATLNLTTKVGSESNSTLITFEETDDKVCTWSYSYPIYQLQNGVYYKADNTETFGESGTFANGDSYERTISYTNPDETVAFYSESQAEASGTEFGYSNGADGHVASDVVSNRGIGAAANATNSSIVLPAGAYVFDVAISADNNRSVVVRQFTSSTEGGTNYPFDADATIYATANYETPRVAFTLTEQTEVVINGANSTIEGRTIQSEDFDYVVIRKALTKTIGDNSYASFSSAYNVTVPQGVTVYTAALSTAGDQVVLTPITTNVIPANTGVILGGAGEFTFSMTTDESTADFTGNDLKATSSEPTVPDTGTFYALKADGTAFAKLTNSIVLSGNKAYLPGDELSSANELSISFGEATGIKAVEASEGEESIYNLGGNPVANPGSGVYIKGGKKFIK